MSTQEKKAEILSILCGLFEREGLYFSDILVDITIFKLKSFVENCTEIVFDDFIIELFAEQSKSMNENVNKYSLELLLIISEKDLSLEK